MLIAFEGPANTGKAHAANTLSGGHAIHSVDEACYNKARERANKEKGIVQCFDRIGWLSHHAYQLALPGHKLEDFPAQAVFTMPDAHLVFKVHTGLDSADTDVSAVNDTYMHLALSYMHLNEERDYSLFKSITLMHVSSAQVQRVLEFSSPLQPWWGSASSRRVVDDLSLLDMLMVEDARR